MSQQDRVNDLTRRVLALERRNRAQDIDIAVAGSLVGNPAGVGMTFDNGSADIDAGAQVDIHIPYAMRIDVVKMFADQIGAIVIDIYKNPSAGFSPGPPDSIVAAAPPTIAADNQSSDSTLAGWTTVLDAHDVLRFTVLSASGVRRCHLIMEGERL